MHFEEDHIYHLYNRGNNKDKIFFSPDNYNYFLKKIQKEWQNYCDILCYCLMPNHFHFILLPKPEGCAYMIHQGQVSHLQVLSKQIGNTLSSYTRAINNQNGTIGTLFQRKTKSKCLTDRTFSFSYNSNYLIHCFWYIHENPVKAGICANKSDWPYSSWKEFEQPTEQSVCNTELAINTIGKIQEEWVPDVEILQKIW